MARTRRAVLSGLAGAATLLLVLGTRLPAHGAENGAAPKDAAPTPTKELALDLGHDVKLELVLIPSGTFRMGSENGFPMEKPVHKVTLQKPFYMGRHEVTDAQWAAVMPDSGRAINSIRAIDRVSWQDCQEFLKRLNERTGRKFSLPSEAEWEFACRAGTTTEYSFGNDPAGLAQHARLPGKWQLIAQDVGRLTPNAWGLFDMLGNVSEWCEDAWHTTYEGAPTDGSPWTDGGDRRFRSIRGSAQDPLPIYFRSPCRDFWEADAPRPLSGCRVVLRDF